MAWGAASSLLLLPFGPMASVPFVLAHLSVLVGFGLAVAVDLAPLAEAGPFANARRTPLWRAVAGATFVVLLATGAVALVTLASSAAARYQPSLQFLQLLSSMDIVWAGATLYLGVRWWRNERFGLVAAGLLGVFCVWSLWNYLGAVGLAADGGWLVIGEEIMRRILPYDMAAAVVAVVSLAFGAREHAAAVAG